MTCEDCDALARRHIPDGYIFASDNGGKVSLRRKIYAGNGLTAALKALHLPIGGYIPKGNSTIEAHQQEPVAVRCKRNVFKRDGPFFGKCFYLPAACCSKDFDGVANRNDFAAMAE